MIQLKKLEESQPIAAYRSGVGQRKVKEHGKSGDGSKQTRYKPQKKNAI